MIFKKWSRVLLFLPGLPRSSAPWRRQIWKKPLTVKSTQIINLLCFKSYIIWICNLFWSVQIHFFVKGKTFYAAGNEVDFPFKIGEYWYINHNYIQQIINSNFEIKWRKFSICLNRWDDLEKFFPVQSANGFVTAVEAYVQTMVISHLDYKNEKYKMISILIKFQKSFSIVYFFIFNIRKSLRIRKVRSIPTFSSSMGSTPLRGR